MNRQLVCALMAAGFSILPACSFNAPLMSSDPAPTPTAATPTTHPAQDSAFSLTVYSTANPATFDPQHPYQNSNGYNESNEMPGYGVVRQVRRLELKAGVNRVECDDVPAGIDPTTVAFKSLTAPDSTSVLEQNFEFDLASAGKLLQKYLGKEVIVQLKQTPGERASAPASFRAKLLSCSSGWAEGYYGYGSRYGTTDALVLKTDTPDAPFLIQPYDSIASIRLVDLQGGLVIKPTLNWKLYAQRAGAHETQTSYQTDGLTWRADYSVLIDKKETAADLSAWVTVVNSSGASYPDAKLKLVAGSVQRLKPERRTSRGGYGGYGGGEAEETGFKQKSFFEYYLYTLGRPTSLPDRSTKQIELFPTRNAIPVTTTYVYYGAPRQMWYWYSDEPDMDRNLGTVCNKDVDVYLMTRNTEKNGLGMPLPAGRVRVYKVDDADGSREFVGEDVIRHTPKDEPILVRVGSAFDIVGERKQTEFHEEDHNTVRESFEITLRNHKPEPVSVIVKENLYRWSNWEITKASEKWEKQDRRTVHFFVTIPAGGERRMGYTVKYTWH